MRKHIFMFLLVLMSTISSAQDSLFVFDKGMYSFEAAIEMDNVGYQPATFDDLLSYKAAHERDLNLLMRRQTRMQSLAGGEWPAIVALDTAKHGWPSAIERGKDGVSLAFKEGCLSDYFWPAGTKFLGKRK